MIRWKFVAASELDQARWPSDRMDKLALQGLAWEL